MVHMHLCSFPDKLPHMYSSRLGLLILTPEEKINNCYTFTILQCLLLVAATLLSLQHLVIVMVSDPAQSTGLDLTHVDM